MLIENGVSLADGVALCEPFYWVVVDPNLRDADC